MVKEDGSKVDKPKEAKEATVNFNDKLFGLICLVVIWAKED